MSFAYVSLSLSLSLSASLGVGRCIRAPFSVATWTVEHSDWRHSLLLQRTRSHGAHKNVHVFQRTSGLQLLRRGRFCRVQTAWLQRLPEQARLESAVVIE